MSRKSTCLLIFLILLFSKAKSQRETERTICCCSSVIEKLSKGWKKDSTILDLYRLNNYKNLMNCKIDPISVSYVTKKLGIPESIGYNKNETDFLYYFFDKNSLSKKILEEIIGIILRFDKTNNQLLETELILNDF